MTKRNTVIRKVSLFNTSEGEVSLHEACREGNLELVEEIQTQIQNPGLIFREEDSKGIIPLHYAAMSGNVEVFEKVLQGSKTKLIETQTRRSFSSILHSAAKGKNVDLLKHLFQHYGELMTQLLVKRNKFGKIPAHCAVRSGSFDVFTYLYKLDEPSHETKCKTTTGENYFTLAAKSGDLELFNAISEDYAFNRITSPTILLSSALRGGNLDIVKKVQEETPSLMAKFGKFVRLDKKTYIFDAIYSENEEVIQHMIDNPGFVIKGKKKFSNLFKMDLDPIEYAAFLGLTSVVFKLIDAYGDFRLEKQPKSGLVPLLHAAAYGGNKHTFQSVFDMYSQKMTKSEILQLTMERKDMGNGSVKKWNLFCFAAMKSIEASYKEGLDFFEYVYKRFDDVAEERDRLLDPNLSISVLDFACESDNLEVVKWLVNNPKYFTESKIGNWCSKATRKQNWNIVRFLFSKQDGTFQERNYGFVWLARYCRDENLIKQALSNLVPSSEWQNALQGALEYGNDIATTCLLQTGFKFEKGNDLVALAAKGGSVKAMNQIIATLAKINPQFDFDQALKEFYHSSTLFAVTPLHLAVYHQHLEMTRFLIEKKADVNSYYPGCSTPLHAACKPKVSSRNVHAKDIVELLLTEPAKSEQKSATLSLNVTVDKYPGVEGTDIKPYDLANSEIRNLIERNYPRASSLRTIIPLSELKKRVPEFGDLFNTSSDRPSGNFGEVQIATYCGTQVAIKALKNESQKDGEKFHELERQFLYEVGLMTKIRHPNCCQLIAASYDELGVRPQFYFVMERLDMDAMTARKNGKLSEYDCYLVACEIAKALNFLHQQLVFSLRFLVFLLFTLGILLSFMVTSNRKTFLLVFRTMYLLRLSSLILVFLSLPGQKKLECATAPLKQTKH